MSRIIRDSLKIGLLLCVPALIAWMSGRPFIFPSLGPSAFSLVIDGPEDATSRRVIGGHLLGVAGGLLAYHLLAPGLTLSLLPPPLSSSLARLAASGVVSVVLTSIGMLVFRARHAPACATTLIVSLGLLPTGRDALCIMAAVGLMYAVFRLLSLIGPADRTGRGTP